MIRAMPWLFLFVLALAWMYAWANREALHKFWEALRKIITFEGLRKKPQKMGMLRDRLVPVEHLNVLRKAALQEHEFNLLPHTDPDIIAVCAQSECYAKRLPKPPKGEGGGSAIIQVAAHNGKSQLEELKNNFQTVYADDQPIMVLGEGMTISPLPKPRPPEYRPDYDLLEEVRNRT